MLENKKVWHDYEILERFEAGIVLLGTEVKSLRSAHGVLAGSHVLVRGAEVYIVGMQVPAYQIANAGKDYDPSRTRKLLLTQNEIATLSGLSARKGLTIVPLSVYTKSKKIKLEIAIVKGKKKFDKREDIKKRDDKRAIARLMRNK